MNSGWYIKAQCQRIRDTAEAIEDRTHSSEISELVQTIILAAYKIQADSSGIDIVDLAGR
jgi:hypothetical protein